MFLFNLSSTPPVFFFFCLPRFSLSKYFRELASSMVRCLERLIRWAAADDMIVWSALLSADHPAGSCCNNDQQCRQETGNRMKKAGHPVHLDRAAKDDIMKASLFHKAHLSRGRKVLLLSSYLTSNAPQFVSVFISISVSLISPSHCHCFPDCSIIPDIKSFSLQREKKGETEKTTTRILIWIYTTNNLTKTKTKKKQNKKAKTFGCTNTRRQDAKSNACLRRHTYTHTDWQTNETQNSKHKAQHSQKSTLCRNILKCVLQYN